MKHKFKNLRKLTFLAIITQIVFITSCNSDGPIMEQPEQIYYDLAQRRMNANNYFSAIEALQAIETNYPFGRYAEQAQSELIYAYYMNGEDEASHEAAEKFIRLNPRHPNIDYAYFMRGISSYTRDKGIFARVFKRDLSDLILVPVYAGNLETASEFRSLFAGSFLAYGYLILRYTFSRKTLSIAMMLTYIMLFIALGRIISFIIDGYTHFGLFVLLGELLLALILFISHKKRKNEISY